MSDEIDFDSDNDSLPDIYFIDTNNDSSTDIWKFTVNSTVINGYDINNDSRPDSYDLNNDGKIEAWDLDGDVGLDQIDLTGDGRVDAYDTDYNGVFDTYVQYNRTLVVFINSPEYGQINGTNDSLRFNGSVHDGIVNGTPPYNFSWNSNIDGFLGYGNNISKKLSLGNHIVTLNIEDSMGVKDNNTVKIIVSLPDIRYINGTVRDSISQENISGAKVSIIGGNSTVSDSFGFYSLAVSEGEYNLTAQFEPTHYANSSIQVSTIGKPIAEQDIELVKKPTGTITGIVSN